MEYENILFSKHFLAFGADDVTQHKFIDPFFNGDIQIIYLLITHPPKVNETTQSDKHEEKLKSIIQYISTHYYEDISIEEIADFCHYSPSPTKVSKSCSKKLQKQKLKEAVMDPSF